MTELRNPFSNSIAWGVGGGPKCAKQKQIKNKTTIRVPRMPSAAGVLLVFVGDGGFGTGKSGIDVTTDSL